MIIVPASRVTCPVEHDDIIKWKHFPLYWPFVWGIHRSTLVQVMAWCRQATSHSVNQCWPVNSPHKGQWCGSLMFSLICALNKRLSIQSRGWWFETTWCPLWRHCNEAKFGLSNMTSNHMDQWWPSSGPSSRLAATLFNTLRPRQNGCRFADDTFKRIFLNENVRISIKISLKFVPKGPINNIPALVQIMARRRSGDKPLSEPMIVTLLTHICVTRPQWVNINSTTVRVCHVCLVLSSLSL